MAAPTFVDDELTVFNTTTTPKSPSAINVTSGQVAVAFVVVADSASGNNTYTCTDNTATSANWVLQEEVDVTGGWASVYVWTKLITTTESTTVTFTRTAGNTLLFGGGVALFSGSDGVGAAESENADDEAGGTLLAITTTAANSALFVVNGDWDAIDGASRTWRTVNSITPTAGNTLERLYFRDAANYTAYAGYYTDVGAAGAKSVGFTAPTNQKHSIAVVEIKGAAGGGGGSTVAMEWQSPVANLIPHYTPTIVNN